MKSYKNRVAIRVMSIHISVIFLALVIPFLRGCFKSKPKEITTFIEFGSPPAEQANFTPDSMPTPTPPTYTPPPPPKDVIPEPTKKPTPKKPKPKKDPPPKKPKPKKDPPKENKWKAKKPDEIKLGRKVEAQSNKPTLTQREIEKTLGGIVNNSNRVGNSNSFAAYDATVQRIFYSAWQQPASGGRKPAKVKITIQGNGRIIARKLVQSSGNSMYDQSVMGAARQVLTLPRPPKGYPDRTFIINFKLDH